MPELPEVETIVRKINTSTKGKEILSCNLQWEGSIAQPSAREFSQTILNQTIQSATRRGKFICAALDSSFMLIHLRMSGDLFVRPVNDPIEKHDRVILSLSGGSALVFNDPRKFGRIWLTSSPDTILDRLGPEPLDKQFTSKVFYSMLHQRHRQLKPLILDQTFLAGMGNIYTDEALFSAKLHPHRISDSLSEDECNSLWKAIRTVLTEGIKRNGASIDWVYKGGDFQNHFKVYGRKNEPCLTCGTPIQKITVGQRGTHFCPNCQQEG